MPHADRRSDEPQVAIGCSRRKSDGYGKTGRSKACAPHGELSLALAPIQNRRALFPVTMTADLRSVPVALLQREIKKIIALINRSVSLDELDRARATLCRLQEALALATIRAKSLAD